VSGSIIKQGAWLSKKKTFDTGSGRVLSLDATVGLLATRWRLWRQCDSSALRSAFVV